MVDLFGESWASGEGMYSANVERAADVSVSIWVSSSSTSSPGASAWALVSPTSRTSPLSLPCMSMSMLSSAVPVEMRTSGSAITGVSIGPGTLRKYLGGIIWGWACFY